MVPLGMCPKISLMWLDCRVEGATQPRAKGHRTLDMALRDLAFILQAALVYWRLGFFFFFFPFY